MSHNFLIPVSSNLILGPSSEKSWNFSNKFRKIADRGGRKNGRRQSQATATLRGSRLRHLGPRKAGDKH